MSEYRDRPQDKFNREVGGRISSYREGQGLSQQELGEMIGMGRTCFGNLERGDRRLDFYSAVKISHALGVGVDDFLDGVEVSELDPGWSG